MTKMVALLKGINVGNSKKIKMADLSALAAGLGFQDVKTYLQSGNLILGTDGKKSDSIRAELEKTIRKKYGFEVSILVRTIKEMKRIRQNNPFIKNKKIPGDRLFVSFLESEPVNKNPEMKKSDQEQFLVAGKEVYLYCPDGYGRTKLNNQAFEKALGVTATTRNWNTVLALADLSDKV